MTTPRRVYFIKPVGQKGPIKIGCSDIPDLRLRDLMCWSPIPLELIGAVHGGFDEENFLHSCFADLHSHREWFAWSQELENAIKTALAANNIEVLRDSLVVKGSIRQKRPRSNSHRLSLSYGARIRWTQRRLRAISEYSAWCAPPDVEKIMRRWESKRDKTPSDDDLRRLEEYLAKPEDHSIIPSWMRGRSIEMVGLVCA